MWMRSIGRKGPACIALRSRIDRNLEVAREAVFALRSPGNAQHFEPWTMKPPPRLRLGFDLFHLQNE